MATGARSSVTVMNNGSIGGIGIGNNRLGNGGGERRRQRIDTRDKNTFVARTNSEFASRPVPHKSTNTIWSPGRLANSEFVLVVNLLLFHV